MKRKIIIAVVLGMLVTGGFVLAKFLNRADVGTFVTVEIKRGTLEDVVSTTGTLSAVSTVQVGAQVSGTLERVLVDFNAEVKKGQVLAVLDTSLLEAALAEAQANRVQAEAKVDQARSEYERNKPLVEKQFLSETEFLVSKTNLETARASLQSARASLARARANLRYAVIRSPIDGTVIERTVDAGQTIAASFATPTLFTVAEDLTRMQIEADVDESDIGRIRVGQAVRFTVQAYPDDTFQGTVRQIRLLPVTIQNVVNYTVVVDAANPDGHLLPGMTATVDFLVEVKPDVLLVPNRALQFKPTRAMVESAMSERARQRIGARIGSGRDGVSFGPSGVLDDDAGMVFIQDDDGKVRVVKLTKGSTNGSETEILSSEGLSAGTRVISGTKDKPKTGSGFSMPRPPGGRRGPF